MNIGDLVKSAVFGLAIAGSACGDTYYNNRDSEESTTTAGYSDPAREICEKFISCCNQVPDVTDQAVCHSHAGGREDSTVSDCMEHFKGTYSLKQIECIAKSFKCKPNSLDGTPAGWNWSESCGADPSNL